MSNTPTQIASDASDTSIGFDYQFYHFFFLLLDLRHGEQIGIEVKDDVHVDMPDGSLLLIQTKHTVQRNAAGEIINLTERDTDLWKTLANWSKVIQEQSDPKKFLNKTTFELATNKQGENNPFITELVGFQNSDIKLKDFKSYLKNLMQTTADETKKKYIKKFYELQAEQLSLFASKMSFEMAHDDLIQKIKERLLEKIHIKERVDDVYTALNSELRDTNYLNTKAGVKNLISFEDFNLKFGKCFKVAISTKLPIRTLPYILPDQPEQQHFIKQMLDIGDITPDEKAVIINYTTLMLHLLNNLKEWEANGDFLESDRTKLDQQTAFIQKNAFRATYRTIRNKITGGQDVTELDDDIKIAAVALLDDMRRQILTFDETQLSLELSHGHFYLLTEERQIGWHLDWEQRYSTR